MSTHNEKFVSSMGCMDGRDRAAVMQLRRHFYVDDVCSGPGTVAIITNPDHPEFESFVKKFQSQVYVSYEKHGSRELLVSGHSGCAGNPVDDTLHKEHICKAAEFARTILVKLGYDDMTVIPVWNDRGSDGNWHSTELES